MNSGKFHRRCRLMLSYDYLGPILRVVLMQAGSQLSLDIAHVRPDTSSPFKLSRPVRLHDALHAPQDGPDGHFLLMPDCSFVGHPKLDLIASAVPEHLTIDTRPSAWGARPSCITYKNRSKGLAHVSGVCFRLRLYGMSFFSPLWSLSLPGPSFGSLPDLHAPPAACVSSGTPSVIVATVCYMVASGHRCPN